MSRPDPRKPPGLSFRWRLILFPPGELPRQRLIWNGIIGEAASRRVVMSQAMVPAAVWAAVIGWIVALSGFISALAVEDRSAVAVWRLVGVFVNVVVIVVGTILKRRFAASAARMLLPTIQPLDPTATVENLATTFGRKPGYFVALAQKHPDRLPPRH